MLVALQLVAVAATPLNFTVLVPCVAPKFVPVITTGVPGRPEAGFKPAIVVAAVVTVYMTPLLGSPPTLTTTLPVAAPLGTVTVMLVALQLVAVAATPLNVTVLVPCVAPKFAPVIVTWVPTAPELGFRLVINASGKTTKLNPLLEWPSAETTTLPVVAPEGTFAEMLVMLQPLVDATVPLKLTTLVPCVLPKFVPVITTTLPTW